MFFELILRNSRKNRKEHGLFFSSLLISIVAFYLILSLSRQDVMRFLADMESDAVNRLLSMIPLFYVVTLFILFFLIYFACHYQLTGRRHEMGMYLMLGMRRYKLFFLVLAEDTRNSIAALIVGIPIGIVLSELISLVTARLVGIGIIGHHLSISVEAIVITAIGFIGIKLIAFLILSGKIAGQEIGDLLFEKSAGSKKQKSMITYCVSLALGIFLLVLSYLLAIQGISWYSIKIMAVTLFSGFLGTILIFYGLRSVMNTVAIKAGKKHKLHTFTFRQLQEMVIHKSNSMAITSLLILAGLCCFGSGAAIAKYYGGSEKHAIDYTFPRIEESQDVETRLKEKKLDTLFSDIFKMKVGYIEIAEDKEEAYSMEPVMKQLQQMKDSREKEVLLNNFSYEDYPHLISLTGYNRLLSLANLPQISLAENEAAVYIDSDFTTGSRTKILNEILKTEPKVQIANESFYLIGSVQSTNLVVDRSITLAFSLIVTDEVFERMTMGEYSTYVNASLRKEQLEGKSLMEAVMETNAKLDGEHIFYESYLQNMGRKLFYVVAASYITIYLAIVFLIVANTIIGVQFLTQQQKIKGRYQILIRLGVSYQALCYSAKKQIYWYFGIPVFVASISSIFGIRALFTGLLPGRTEDTIVTLILISVVMILLICMVEYVYMRVVTKSSNRFLLSLMTPEREE